jgi:SAM-dependent methyltransferase
MISLLKKIKNLHNYFFPKNILSKWSFIFFWEYGFLRFLFFFIFSKLKKYNHIQEATKGVDYSKKSFFQGNIPVYRPDYRIFYPFFLLNAIPEIKKDTILILGPRYETEILLARAFEFKTINALDNFSYSPLIEVGDIHKMPYQDEKFDNIICGYTFSYSTSPLLFANEMHRVLKNNGILIIAVQKVDNDNLDSVNGTLAGNNRIQSKNAFDNFFPTMINFCYIQTANHILIGYKKAL